MSRRIQIRVTAVLLCALMVCTGSILAQHPLPGRWEGAIKLPGMDLGILVEFTPVADSLRGTIDIPMQMAKGLQLRDISEKGSAVQFALQAGPGLASFTGTAGGDSIAGIFTQSTVKCPFILHRAKALPPPTPPPYKEEEVQIEAGGVTLAGTLTLPPSTGPHPAAILLTGSGPQTRDEEIFGFAVFRVIADHLTRSGYAVLRCDDRGVGSSTGEYAAATTRDFATDALAQWRYLCTRKEIATSQIGLVGHSEGAIAAAIACHAEPAIAFAVLLAGPAVRGDSLILGQLERMARLSGAPDSAIQQAIRAQQQVYATVRADTGWSSLRSMLVADLRRSFESTTPEQRSALGNIDSTIAARADVKMAQIRSPWFRQFVLFDPAEDLRGMSCPVLALFGSLDTQVPPAQNQTRMEKLFKESGNRAALCKLIPDANHLFQAAQTGSPMEYGSLKKEFAPGVLESISQWMLKVKNSKEN